jgi:hypothetical protein
MPAIARIARSYTQPPFPHPFRPLPQWLQMPPKPARSAIEKSLEPAPDKACALPPVALRTATMNGHSAKTPLDQGSIPCDGNMPPV